MDKAPASPRAPAGQETRNFALDALRGLIVVLMALDHANYFVAQQHPSGEYWGGPFPAYDSPVAFLTRLVTHPVAPGFAFLMGIGMVLFAASRRRRGWSEWEIVRHFLTRGAFLIVLQFTVVNLAWRIGPFPFPTWYVGVLVALGGGMMLGSLFLRLKAWQLGLLGALLVIGIELSHPETSQWGQIFDQPLGLVFGYSGGDAVFWSNYPILTWLELVVLGMAFGKWMLTDSGKALRWSTIIGAACLAGFALVRILDGFGNIRPRAGDSWMDYLNVVKYPPALTFTLLTMGVNLILLGVFARTGNLWRRYLKPFVVLGRVPLFFYVLHLYLYAGLGAWLTPGGTSLPTMYLYWLVGLVILLPLCSWYGRFKQGQPADSLIRFL